MTGAEIDAKATVVEAVAKAEATKVAAEAHAEVAKVETVNKLRSVVTESWTRKTWKREAAAFLLVVWAAPSVHLLTFATVDRMNAAAGLYSIMTTAVFTFALGAFGLDAWFKQAGTLASLASTPKPEPGAQK